MKRLSRILPFLLAASLAVPSYAQQQQNGSVTGRVLDRDGVTGLQGVQVVIDMLATTNGRLTIRERQFTKTGRDGRYSISGLYVGRVRVTVVQNEQMIMSKGDAVGEEIFLINFTDTVVNFDLSKAPPPAAAAPAATGPSEADKAALEATARDREALREKFEKEAAAQGLMNKAFDAGKAAFIAKNYDEAITNFKTAIEKMPSPPPTGVADVIWANLAKTYDAKKEWPEMAAAYKKAIEYKPTESNYYLNLSLAQIGAGQLKESEESIAMAAKLNPANAGMAYYNLGATLINRNQPQEALANLQKAIELDPKYANAYYEAGLVLLGMEKKETEAVNHLSKYLELVPTGEKADIAKALLEELRKTAPTSFTAPEAQKKAAETKSQPTKTNKSR